MKSSVRNIFNNEAEVTHDATVHLHRLIKQGDIDAKIATFNFAWLHTGEKLAEHAHDDCVEYFLVLSGTSIVYLDDEATEIVPGSFITIMPGTQHHIHNNGTEDLKFVTLRAFVA